MRAGFDCLNQVLAHRPGEKVMDEAAPGPEPLTALIEDYLTGQIDEARLRDLEARLRDDPEARREFVRYARLHTDLHFELRAREASERVLDAIARQTDSPPTPAEPAPPRHGLLRRRALVLSAVAAGLLVVTAVGWWIFRSRSEAPEVAWLVNAQNCTWTGGEPPTDLRPGKVLAIDGGLAEFRFQGGARLILEGPARLELLSATSARLHQGRLTARVAGASGFEVLSPQGRVVDHGTEFGVAVSSAGATSVRVFEGRVEVLPAGAAPATAVSLIQDQAARIADGKVTVEPVRPEDGPDRFVRSIVPEPLVTPHTLKLTFERPAAGGIRDSLGVPTGLTHRFPGTGRDLPDHDPHLRLNSDKGQLELTTTDSDLNTRYQLGHGEYLGVRLADLGFTGVEDFAVSATSLDIPALEFVGQFGVYAGVRNDQNIRGGLLSSSREEAGQYKQFLVNNRSGKDIDVHKVGLLGTGADLRMTLRRTAGRYTLMVENLTAGTTSTLTTRHPQFLDGERDLSVGVFGANTQSKVQRVLVITEFQATVWTLSPPPAP
jgi:ferric-dicitrate binding protein FerR (iron transport regulator)